MIFVMALVFLKKQCQSAFFQQEIRYKYISKSNLSRSRSLVRFVYLRSALPVEILKALGYCLLDLELAK